MLLHVKELLEDEDTSTPLRVNSVEVSGLHASGLAIDGAFHNQPPALRLPTSVDTTFNVDSFDMQMIGIVVQLAAPKDDATSEEK